MSEATVKDRDPKAAPVGEKPIPNAAKPTDQNKEATAEQPEKKVPVGIEGVGIKQEVREMPDSEPPALPVNNKLHVIGKRTPRLDGRLKVTGRAKYTADINLPGMLHGRLIVSSITSGRIKSVDTSESEKIPGFKAIHFLNENGGKGMRVRYQGEPIGAVAATTAAAAEDVVRALKIEYEALPWVVDTTKAKDPDAPVIYEKAVVQEGSAGGGGAAKNVKQEGNVRGPDVKGDRDAMEKAMAEAEVILEGEFRTQVQTHCALETHGVVADWKPEQLTVWASTQGTGSVRDDLAATFKLKKSQVRVITEYMGGGFGAKFGGGAWGKLAANLSKAAGAPVKLMCDRRQEHLTTGNRPNSFQKYKLGAKKDGTLLAIYAQSYGTGGTGGGAGALKPVNGMYTHQSDGSPVAIVTEDSDVFTNAGPASAFRAPGHPQGVFALEQMIDELAEKVAIDPLQLRDKIEQHTGRSEVHRRERQVGAKRFEWVRRQPAGSSAGPIKKGMGVAQSMWHRFMSRDSHCEVRITRDGSIELMSAVQDIGGGIRTALAQIVAEEFGLEPKDITIKIGDTIFPAGPASGGSMTTNSISPAARNAAVDAKKKFCQAIAAKMGTTPDNIAFSQGNVFKADSDKNPRRTFKQAAKLMDQEEISARVQRSEDYNGADGKGIDAAPGGLQFAEVTVDTETGHIKVDRVLAVHDCGRPINPLALESQINGGVIQGISYALLEDRILDRQTGFMVNPNLEQYKIVGSKDTPKIEVMLVEQYAGKSSTDAGPIGEPATVCTAAAIANAVYNAIGVRIREIPMTPRVVLEAIAKARAGKDVETAQS